MQIPVNISLPCITSLQNADADPFLIFAMRGKKEEFLEELALNGVLQVMNRFQTSNLWIPQ